MDKVCLPIWRPHTRVVYVGKWPLKAINCAIHYLLKSLHEVGQPIRSEQKLKQAKWHDNCCFWDVLFRDGNLVVTFNRIDLWKNCSIMPSVWKVLHVWQRILVRGCNQVEMAVIRKAAMIYLFWRPFAKRKPMMILNARQCQWIPNAWIPLWQFKVFLDQGGRLLRKPGVAARVNVVFHSVRRRGQHITGAKNWGIFLKQTFYICRHWIRNGLHWAWLSYWQNIEGWV